MRAGHIPGAVSLPAKSLQAGGSFLPPQQLAAKFAAAGVDLGRPLTAYCTTGILASAVALAARLAAPAGPPAAIYDAGWLEWGRLAGVPIER